MNLNFRFIQALSHTEQLADVIVIHYHWMSFLQIEETLKIRDNQ